MEIVTLIVVLVLVVVGLTAGAVTLARRDRPRPVPRSTSRTTTLPPPGRSTTDAPTEEAVADGTTAPEVERAGGTGAEADVDAEVDLSIDLGAEEETLDLDAELEQLLEAPPLLKPSFRERLGKARGLLAGYLGQVRSRGIDEETWEQLEEALIRADVGVEESTALLDDLRARVREQSLREPEEVLDALKDLLKARLGGQDRSLRLDEGTTNVWLFVGVNGVGKTTT